MNGLQWDQGRNKKILGNKWKWTHNYPKPVGHSKGTPEWEVDSNTAYLQEIEKPQKKPNPIPKRTRGISEWAEERE